MGLPPQAEWRTTHQVLQGGRAGRVMGQRRLGSLGAAILSRSSAEPRGYVIALNNDLTL